MVIIIKNQTQKTINKNKNLINRQQYDSAVNAYGEEKFSYNYTNTNTTYETKNSSQNSKKDFNLKEKRVNLNEHFNQMQSKTHKPKRTIKSCKKNQFNVEKSDNFNVLSYRPKEYESDINANRDTSKIIRIYKKQEVDEIFIPVRELNPLYQKFKHHFLKKRLKNIRLIH